jgi:hypothetical protein
MRPVQRGNPGRVTKWLGEEITGRAGNLPTNAGLVLRNALVATELSKPVDWPKTGLEEIKGDLPQADFGTAMDGVSVKT